jgi:hypothetical protein
VPIAGEYLRDVFLLQIWGHKEHDDGVSLSGMLVLRTECLSCL